MPLPDNLLLGTSSWSAPSWVGPFYPPGTASGDFLAHYARRFRSVEIDATWYRSPSARTVEGWNRATPEGFVFAAKVPQSITHEKLLAGCEEELDQFVSTMRLLGGKLGPLLLQFPYFSRAKLPHLDAFLERLIPFLELLPDDVRFALEVRNKAWLQPALFEPLRRKRVALAWTAHPWMPPARQYPRIAGSVTADFLYVRWLGDRHKIEEITTEWDHQVYDMAPDIGLWVEVLRQQLPRLQRVHGYFNNHYAGCAFQTAMQFEEAWEK